MAAPTSTHRVHLGMRVTLLSVLLLVIALIAGFASPASAASRAAGKACRDKSENTRRLDLKGKGEKTFGYFALPNRKPRGLVVFFHGNTQSAITSRSTLKEIARRADAIAVAMDFRHQDTDLDKDSPTYGRSTDRARQARRPVQRPCAPALRSGVHGQRGDRGDHPRSGERSLPSEAVVRDPALVLTASLWVCATPSRESGSVSSSGSKTSSVDYPCVVARDISGAVSIRPAAVAGERLPPIPDPVVPAVVPN